MFPFFLSGGVVFSIIYVGCGAGQVVVKGKSGEVFESGDGMGVIM